MKISILFTLFVTVIIFEFDGTFGCLHQLIRAHDKFHSFFTGSKGKLLSLLEACFGLISSPSLSMKIQIMGGKITENLGFKSPLWKVKTFLFFFLSIFKFFTQNWVSLILTTFLYLV